MILASIPLGLMVERYSRARLLLLFTTLALVGSVMTALVSGMVWLFISRCIVGLSASALLIAVPSLLADLYPPAQRGRAGIVVGMGEIGGAPAAFALGGALLTVAAPADWRWALLWLSAALVPAALIMLAMREPPRTGSTVERPRITASWKILWQFRALVLPLLIARIMVWIADGAALIWAAPALTRHFALAPNYVGTLMATILLVSGIAGPIGAGLLADLCHRTGGPRRTMAALAGLALLSLPAGLFAVMPGLGSAVVLLAAFLTLGFMIGGAAMTVSIIVVPNELRGLFVAVSMATSALVGIAAAPILVSGLSTLLGGASMLGTALAIVCTVSSV
jgi:MFS family permease